jgi:hypothetical protein
MQNSIWRRLYKYVQTPALAPLTKEEIGKASFVKGGRAERGGFMRRVVAICHITDFARQNTSDAAAALLYR